MLNLNLRTTIADILQEIPGCISVFIWDNETGNEIARAIQNGNISMNSPENKFFQLQQLAKDASWSNGEEQVKEIVISGEKQTNLMIMLRKQKYVLWISTNATTKLGLIRFKISKFLNEIDKIL